MAKEKKATTPKISTKSIEETLWEAANKLRGSIEASEYKHVVLSLIFLKYASDKFEERRAEIIAQGDEAFVDMVEGYTLANLFYIPEIARWNYLISQSKQADLANKIDKALASIEAENPALKDALPNNYYTNLRIEPSKLASLLDTINKIEILANKENDLMGRVYEYFLKNFAIMEGKGKGEFYTPKSIVKLIAEMIEPYNGIVYDPCCGAGGMFVQSIKFIEEHKGSRKNVSVYGQEYTATTYKLARMNLAVRGISANLGEMPANTFSNDQHKNLKADYIMANPPFNQKDWRAANELTDDPRWRGYNVPPMSNANYGWILTIVSKLSTNGIAGFLLANGALGDADTLSIRKQLIFNGVIEAIVVLPRDMFYSTDISVTLWILNNNKKARNVEKNGEIVRYRDRQHEILFMDLRRWGTEFEKKYMELTDQDIEKVAQNYHN